jgi:hypothetical protein
LDLYFEYPFIERLPSTLRLCIVAVSSASMKCRLLLMVLFAPLVCFSAKTFDAPPESLDSLIKNSPFPQQAAGSSPTASGPQLELRGVSVIEGETLFSIYDVATRRSKWVGLNESGSSFIVRRYDPAKGTVAIEYQGREISLELKQAKVQAMAPVASTPAPGARPAPGPGAPSPGPGPQPAGELPSDEAKRLAAIAEEIGRRRAQRQQMLRSQPGPQPVRQVPPPAPGSTP